jgi:hypothetical protein
MLWVLGSILIYGGGCGRIPNTGGGSGPEKQIPFGNGRKKGSGTAVALDAG